MDHWRHTKRRKMKIIDYYFLVGLFLISADQTLQLTANINKNGNKYPTYSLQNMPKTDFSCREKILGGYYADAETQCQMFHICVKIAGVGVQDFRFLCPNGTAFDQEAQTCADFGDVDCEQATLFYGSDNFDLYRIGSGFERKLPTPVTEDESTFHLQRSESNDLRRSKQPIVVQNAIYNVGSSFNQKQYELSSVKPANQYQSPKIPTTTTTPRTALTTRKFITTTTPFFNSKPPTPLVLVPANSNNNDEIFKGSHSSNFYSNRNNNDDYDDYKRQPINNSAKNRHRSRGRIQYRGTSATTTSTTTFKPPVVQNYSTLTAFTAKSTTQSPQFKFTFSSTVRANPFSHMANQINSTPLGPLQQQLILHTNYNRNYNSNNFDNFKVHSTTSVPVSSTQRSNFRTNNFNNLITTQSTYHVPLRQVVSAPTPFNSNHLNVKTFEGNNVTDKSLAISTVYKNSNIYSNNLYNSNSSNLNRQQNAREFDNHNVINNYQTTSPFSNQRIIANHLTTNNNTVLRPTSTLANAIGSPTFTQQKPSNTSSFYPSSQHFVTTPLQLPSITQSARNLLSQERPNFNQQDLINRFNLEQSKLTQQNLSQNNNNNNNINNIQNNNQRQNDAQTYLSLEQKRLQLHYDINDYLTTDKQISSQYSPTSEQYRSVQQFSNSNVKALQSNQFFKQKNQDPLISTTPKINRLSIETNYNQQDQTKQDRPSQSLNHRLNFNAQISDKNVHATTTKRTSSNNNNIISTSTKKFSTLVPKDNYAPTTFKPLFYFNVAKQINDNLSTPTKSKAINDNLITSTTLKSNPTTPIFNRNPDFSQFNFRDTQSNKPQTLYLEHQALKQPQKNVSEIDENDGQYHAELYEKDFARYKIKNRKKQQQTLQRSFKPIYPKNENGFGTTNKQQYNSNRGTQKNFSNSAEEEFLNTAHSQNIVASGNELWAQSKNSANSKQSNVPVKVSTPKVPTISSNEKKSTSKDEKDVSYDYAYYDSANDTPHEYSEFDLPDFGKTQTH